MIKAILGKPRNGKSTTAVRFLLDELRTTRRPIIANEKLGLIVPQVVCYMLNKYGSDFGAVQRITILNAEQTFEFWKHARNQEEWVLHEGEYKKLKVGGCVFFLDEIHRIFPSADSMDTSKREHRKEMTNFLSIHGHLGHDIYYITQHLQLLDKNWLRLTQDFIEITNLGLQKWGWFLPPKRFEWSVFLTPPTQANSSPCEKGKFSMDVEGIQSCYKTAAGDESFSLQRGDRDHKRKGLPIWLAPLFVVLFIGVCFFALRGCNQLSKNTLQKAKEIRINKPSTNGPSGGFMGHVKNSMSNFVGQSSLAPSSGPAALPGVAPVVVEDQNPKERVLGWQMIAGRREIILDNGEIISEGIQSISKQEVWIRGRKYLWAEKKVVEDKKTPPKTFGSSGGGSGPIGF